MGPQACPSTSACKRLPVLQQDVYGFTQGLGLELGLNYRAIVPFSRCFVSVSSHARILAPLLCAAENRNHPLSF